ncbi:sodium:proton antiporter [Microbacterium mangrovi]|uniref:Sodium:proton antiporter n=1 Tax=Microbacterium mangrovi TaxID=1348253 RepID=A0A0B1ZXN2_9MICO|nr:Na+/H+ antiporter [Microbacterium mangrovi]KHK95509.1 sodium:proton antiporter [Microbacterium mangrovi]
MHGLEVTVLLGIAILVGTLLAPRLRLATPLVLLVLGLLLGFVPALRDVELPPETVLLLFLPVMLFWESLTTSLRSIRRDFRYIAPMSTLLVVASAFAVAGLATLLGLPWEASLILGAAVAPPDATAVAALGRLLPQRTFMKLKAESLTNDGTALVIYAIAVSLAVGGHVSGWTITWTVLVSYIGGAAAGVLGAVFGWLVLRRLQATLPINLTLLLVPFVSFLLAELVGASGVLAVVVAGLIIAWISPRVTTAASRRQAEAMWPFGVFVLNGALFVLIGLEVQLVVHEISPSEIWSLVLASVAVWAALLVVRYVFQLLSAPFTHPAPGTSFALRNRMRVVSTFAGFRGAVSLAIAMSVPLTTNAGAPLPGRSEIVFVTAGVIVLGLVIQGPLLPALIRWARYPRDTTTQDECDLIERAISGAAVAALDDLAAEHGISDEVRDRTRRDTYEMLELANARSIARQRAAMEADAADLQAVAGTGPLADEPDAGIPGPGAVVPDAGGPGVGAGVGADAAGFELEMLAVSTDIDVTQRSPLVKHEEHTRLKLALLDRKREVLLRLRSERVVDDLVVRRVQGRLDLEEVRLRGIEAFD